jgi:hypothetical protein
MFFFVTSCNRNSNIGVDQSLLGIVGSRVNNNDLNKSIYLRLNRESSQFEKSGDLILLDIVNVSGNEIGFPNDHNLIIFGLSRDTQEWVEITENNVKYSGDGDMIYANPKGTPSDYTTLPIGPIIDEPTTYSKLVIFVSGNMLDDGKVMGELVSGSIEILINNE